DCQRLFLSRLRFPARPAQRRAPRRGSHPGGPGRTGYLDGIDRGAHPVPPPGRKRRGHPRVLPAPVPRQGRGDRPRMGHGRLQQPGSAEPVAQPRSQPVRARSGLRQRPARAPATVDGRGLPGRRRIADATVASVAGADPAAVVPLPAPLSVVGRLAARAPAGNRDAAAGAAGRGAVSRSRHPRWRLLWRVLFAAFLVLVATLLVRYARNVDWRAVFAALAAYDAATLLLVGGLTAASYLVYATYDLAGRRYAGHALSARRVLLIAATSYAFALSLGALVGGAGFRFRMYAHSGLAAAPIARVVAFSMATNWLGYIALAGIVFASGAVVRPRQWGFGGGVLQAAGVVRLLLAGGYRLACAKWRGRSVRIRGHPFRLPSPGLGAVQLGIAALNCSLMGTILFVLLGGFPAW